MNKKLIFALVALVAVHAATAPMAAPTAASSTLCNPPPTSSFWDNGQTTTNYGFWPGYGFVWSGESCVPCQYGCSCAAAGKCDACLPGFMQSADGKSCIPPVGGQMKTDFATQIPNCNKFCVDATGTPACSECALGYYFSGAKCASCVDTNCAACTAPASATVNPTCTACKAGFYYKKDATAGTSSCQAIDTTALPNCAVSSFDGATCTACSSGFSLVSGKCVTCSGAGVAACSAADTISACLDGYFMSVDATTKKNICTACSTSCRLCTSATTCTACNAGSDPANDWVGFFWDATATKCTACESNAVFCTSATVSLVCKNGKAIIAGATTCSSPLSSCVKHTSATVCATCSSTTILSVGVCVSITSTATSLNCLATGLVAGTDTVAVKCKDQTGCIAATSTYKYVYDPATFKCLTLDPNCGDVATSTNYGITAGVATCKVCSTTTGANGEKWVATTGGNCVDVQGYNGAAGNSKAGYLLTASAVKGCYQADGTTKCDPATTVDTTNGCKTGYQAVTETSTEISCTKKCTDFSGCKTCTIKEGDKCSTCDDTQGWVATPTSGACVACATTCTSCRPTYLLANAACTQSSDATTVTNCKTWSNTACTACNTGFYLNGSALCVACDTSCSTCDSTGCTACPSTSSYVDATTKKCVACPTGCDKCTSATACTACTDGGSNNILLLSTKLCGADTNCYSVDTTKDVCKICKAGYLVDTAVNNCKACAATGCTTTCQIPPAPPAAGGAAATTSSSSASILSFAFSAILLVLAFLF